MNTTMVCIGLAAASMSALAGSAAHVQQQKDTPAFAATASTSPQRNEEQKHSQWCWNASVRNLIYTESGGSIDAAQCDIANYAFGIKDACEQSDTFKSKHVANRGNWLKNPKVKDAHAILRRYGFRKLHYQDGALPFAAIQRSIDRNHGILTSWRWNNGVGHQVVAYGYHVRVDGTPWIKLSDPWPGEGESWRTYAAYAGGSEADHTTKGSLRVVD